MVLAVTGHRPGKLYGYNMLDDSYKELYELIKKIIIKEKPDKAITGMAIGVDLLFANAVIAINDNNWIDKKIHLHAALPCLDQETKWPNHTINAYNELLSRCDSTKIIVNELYADAKYCMHARNKYMVDNCDILLAVWDGTPGGTGSCVKYAKSVNKHTIYLNPSTLKMTVYKKTTK